MPAWIGSPGDADHRGFTHRSRHYRGFTHRPESTGRPHRAAIEAERPASLWITGPESRFSGSTDSGDHPPSRRGITHRAIGGSHTESRGFTHPPHSQPSDNKAEIPLRAALNLLNDSSLTESLNPERHRWTNRIPLGQGNGSSHHQRHHPSERGGANGIGLTADALWLRAAFGVTRAALRAAGFRESQARPAALRLRGVTTRK